MIMHGVQHGHGMAWREHTFIFGTCPWRVLCHACMDMNTHGNGFYVTHVSFVRLLNAHAHFSEDAATREAQVGPPQRTVPLEHICGRTFEKHIK